MKAKPDSVMDESDIFGDYGAPNTYSPLTEPQLRARLQHARRALRAYAREEGIDLGASRLTREQLYDRKLARMEMVVANLEREFLIEG